MRWGKRYVDEMGSNLLMTVPFVGILAVKHRQSMLDHKSQRRG